MEESLSLLTSLELLPVPVAPPVQLQPDNMMVDTELMVAAPSFNESFTTNSNNDNKRQLRFVLESINQNYRHSFTIFGQLIQMMKSNPTMFQNDDNDNDVIHSDPTTALANIDLQNKLQHFDNLLRNVQHNIAPWQNEFDLIESCQHQYPTYGPHHLCHWQDLQGHHIGPQLPLLDPAYSTPVPTHLPGFDPNQFHSNGFEETDIYLLNPVDSYSGQTTLAPSLTQTSDHPYYLGPFCHNNNNNTDSGLIQLENGVENGDLGQSYTLLTSSDPYHYGSTAVVCAAPCSTGTLQFVDHYPHSHQYHHPHLIPLEQAQQSQELLYSDMMMMTMTVAPSLINHQHHSSDSIVGVMECVESTGAATTTIAASSVGYLQFEPIFNNSSTPSCGQDQMTEYGPDGAMQLQPSTTCSHQPEETLLLEPSLLSLQHAQPDLGLARTLTFEQNDSSTDPISESNRVHNNTVYSVEPSLNVQTHQLNDSGATMSNLVYHQVNAPSYFVVEQQSVDPGGSLKVLEDTHTISSFFSSSSANNNNDDKHNQNIPQLVSFDQLGSEIMMMPTTRTTDQITTILPART